MSDRLCNICGATLAEFQEGACDGCTSDHVQWHNPYAWLEAATQRIEALEAENARLAGEWDSGFAEGYAQGFGAGRSKR
jgi:hypothetical protein